MLLDDSLYPPLILWWYRQNEKEWRNTNIVNEALKWTVKLYIESCDGILYTLAFSLLNSCRYRFVSLSGDLFENHIFFSFDNFSLLFCLPALLFKKMYDWTTRSHPYRNGKASDESASASTNGWHKINTEFLTDLMINAFQTVSMNSNSNLWSECWDDQPQKKKVFGQNVNEWIYDCIYRVICLFGMSL